MGLFSKLFNLKVKEESEIEREKMPINVDYSSDFLMIVEDVFTIVGRGTVVTGKISKGSIQIGEELTLNGKIKTRVLGIEAFRKILNEACAGDNVGLLLEQISRDQVKRGDTLTK